MKRKTNLVPLTAIAGALCALVLGATTAMAAAGPPIEDAIWADGQLYGVILTPTDLPLQGPFDGIYNFRRQAGQQSVAEAKPGDQDYNGGRWEVTLVGFTEEGLEALDQDGDGIVDEDLMSWEEVEQAIGDGYVEVLGPGPHFMCPLIP